MKTDTQKEYACDIPSDWDEATRAMWGAIRQAKKDGIAKAWHKKSPFKGENFMTPDTLEILSINGRAVEISCGRGMTGGWIIGVTVAHNFEASGLVHSLAELSDKLQELAS